MYFSGKLEIDPSHLTVIEKIKPTSAFKKLLNAVSLGIAGNEKEEHETFSAISITQQLYSALSSMGINDIVRIRMNSHDFYLDEHGEKNDLDIAMNEFQTMVDSLEAKVFDNILIVTEHEENKIKYLVEIKIVRKHKVGEYPIQLIVNGVLNEFKINQNENEEVLKTKMKSLFASKEHYTEYVNTCKNQFDNFVNNMELSIRKFIQSDDIKNSTKAKIIRAKDKSTSSRRYSSNYRNDYDEYDNLDPIYHGYFAMNSYFMYSWIWSEMAYQNNVYINDVDIVDENGSDVLSIGENGFNAGEFDTLNESADFEVPTGADVEAFAGNEFEDTLSESGIDFGGDSDIIASEGSSWLSDFSSGDSDFGDFGDFD